MNAPHERDDKHPDSTTFPEYIESLDKAIHRAEAKRKIKIGYQFKGGIKK
uniref:Uncharacterized protein n=1 Tax=viral metagenome TaxID=1070528 RepID=A0A6M3J206_9ZZZZ